MAKDKLEIQNADSDISLNIKNFCRLGNNISSIHYPFESTGMTRLVASIFGEIPFIKTFSKISLLLIKELIPEFSFTELLRNELFNKEEKKYSRTFNGFINVNQNVFLELSMHEDVIDRLESLVHNDESSSYDKESIEDNVVDIVVFYNLKTNREWLSKLLSKIEHIALEDYKVKVKKNSINFLCCYSHGFSLKNIKMSRKFNGNLELNYGDSFLEKHNHLVKFLDSDETGLAILHGSYGLGKTFYIRHLLSILNKKVIYIPPHLVSKVAEPDFLSFLLEQNNFILVIEDAEEIITNRKDAVNTAGVSNLLNLSDGILGDCIRVKIVVTFNCEMTDIDPALLRKGRLKLQHEFKKLEPAQANRLFKHLGIDKETNEAMSLSDVYGALSINYGQQKVKRSVGFGK